MWIRTAAAACVMLWAGSAAQAQVGTFGACMLESGTGEPVNLGSCELKPPVCGADGCRKVFYWQGQDFETIIEGGGPDQVRDGRAMNGQEAYAPAALIDRDKRDCIYNAVTDGVFCFIPAPEAHMLAADGLDAYGAVMELVGATPVAMPDDGVMTEEDAGESGDEVAALLDAMQGKYRPVPNWSCGEIGAEGGATAIQDSVLYGLETACQLSDGFVIGEQGAVLFQALCEGEGDTWEDEFLLRLDNWGALVVSSLDGASLWQACEN